MKLKNKRSRSVDEVIVRPARPRIQQQEPGIDVEFVQVLQDMIGDLSNAPEPMQIKLFSPDAALLSQWAPQVGEAIGKDRWRGRHPQWHRQHSQRAGHGLSS